MNHVRMQTLAAAKDRAALARAKGWTVHRTVTQHTVAQTYDHYDSAHTICDEWVYDLTSAMHFTTAAGLWTWPDNQTDPNVDNVRIPTTVALDDLLNPDLGHEGLLALIICASVPPDTIDLRGAA